MGSRSRLLSVCALLACGACVTEYGDDDENLIEQGILAPPASVMVTATAPDRVTVSWSAVAGAVKYYIAQGTNSTGPFSYINTVVAPGTSLRVAHLTPGANYCFVVYTEDGTGAGAPSTAACTNTQSTPQPPSSVVATQASPTAVQVDWMPVQNATKYYVFRSTSQNGSFSFLTTVLAPGTTFFNSGLAENGTYCYQVAVDINGYISPFSTAHCNTSLQPPTNVTATRTTAGRITVAWQAAATATRYFVYESRGGAPYALVASVLAPGTMALRANLQVGVEHCYVVRSNVGATASPHSLPPACATP